MKTSNPKLAQSETKVSAAPCSEAASVSSKLKLIETNETKGVEE